MPRHDRGAPVAPSARCTAPDLIAMGGSDKLSRAFSFEVYAMSPALVRS